MRKDIRFVIKDYYFAVKLTCYRTLLSRIRTALWVGPEKVKHARQ